MLGEFSQIRIKYYIYVVSLLIGLFLSTWKPMIQGDIYIYKSWGEYLVDGNLLGLSDAWVYPYIASLPMVLALLGSFIVKSYSLSWIIIVFILNIVAFTMFEKTFRSKITVYHVIAYSLVNIFLFEIFLFRLDGIAIPVTLIAIVLFKKHKYISYLILFVFALIKIWPVAFIIGLWLSSKTKKKDSLVLVSYLTLLMVIPNLFFGHVFDFINTQKDRGIQMESVFSTPFAFVEKAFYFDKNILTYQVDGLFVNNFYMSLATYSMFIVISLVTLVFWWNNKNNFTFEKGLLVGSYITVVFIALNKIGSPQFLGWMQIVILCLAVSIPWNKEHKVLVSLLVSAVLFTGLLTPIFYVELIKQSVIGILCLSIKSVSLLALLIYFSFVILRRKPIYKK